MTVRKRTKSKAEEFPDFQPGFTRRLWSHKELAEGLHLSRAHVYRLLDQGHMLGPDVVVADNSYGWDPRRARRFGADTDRLDTDGNPIGPPADGGLAKTKTLIKTRYSVTPRVYLSSWLVSYAYDLQKATVYFMRTRQGGSGFIPADVVIGEKKFGWSEPRVIEFGEQTGRLDDAGIDKWVVRRTEEFGLSPDIGWVQQRLAARPALVSPVERALEAWRVSQGQEVTPPRG